MFQAKDSSLYKSGGSYAIFFVFRRSIEMSQRASVKMGKARPRGRTSAWQMSKGRRQHINRSPAVTAVVTQGMNTIFPNRKLVTMRYSERLQAFSGGIGTGDSQVYRANSIFDPDFTGLGHQAMGHDEYGQFYLHYRVLSAKISVQFSQNDGSTVPITCWVNLQSTPTVTPLGRTVIEAGKASWKVIGTFGNDQAKPLSNVYDAVKYFDKGARTDDAHKALMTTNPVEDVYFVVGYEPTLAGDTGVGVTGMTVIDYLVELSEPKQLAES